MTNANHPLDLAVIIVSWNVQALLRKCLVSLQADIERAGESARIIVVDSFSHDGSPAMVQNEFPSVELIACNTNIGFVKGNNLGLERLGIPNGASAQESRSLETSHTPPFVWLLNPDTEVCRGTTQMLLEFMRRHVRCGMCGPKLLNPDRSLQPGAFAFPGLVQLALETQPILWRFRNGRLDGRYTPSQYASGIPFRVGHPLGAAMMVRAAAIGQVGWLDPGYEMYAEEVDWAMRMRRAGWERWCVPSAQVIHYGGASSGQAADRVERIKWRSRQRYYDRYYPPLKRWVAKQMVPVEFRP
ncbi:MAG: glycosyltransferase family 2 protein [Chloroflexi bacterium]|nr:glycosyltransferase family 2 protein [Chloroflexota bacterium]